MEKCVNCFQRFNGTFCPNCGEKILEEKDFKLKNILTQAFDTFINFDSKVFKTLKLLFFYPGKISQQNIKGIRVPYLKPFQVFLIANIIFFIFLSDIDIFRTPSKWFFNQNYEGMEVLKKVKTIALDKNLSITAIANQYDSISSNLSKSLLFLLIPFIALINFFLNFNKKIAFGKHVIIATHLFSFILLICVIDYNVFYYIPKSNKWFFIIPILILTLVYYVITFKNNYQDSWLKALVKGLIAFTMIIFLFQFYKMFINFISLHSL